MLGFTSLSKNPKNSISSPIRKKESKTKQQLEVKTQKKLFTNEMDKFLTINSGENLEDKIFRVDKNTNLTLRPGPRCVALEVNLKTNYPLKKGTTFNRSEYYDLSVLADHQDLISSSFNWHATLKLENAGTFHFICSTSNGEVVWQAYIIVNPEMKIPLNSIKCQTVLSKNLGPFKEWRNRLTVTKDLRYNMIHFTPIQELGSSNSAYALRNQHNVNPMFKTTLDEIKKEVDFMEKKWNILSVTDIVLNHTADDSPWIHKHPECAYNLSNSPHLRPAFLLDSAFIWLAKDMASGLLMGMDDLSAEIRTERDVTTIGVLLKTFYIPHLKIYELYMINVAAAMANFNNLQRGDHLEIDYGQYIREGAQVTSIPREINTPQELEQLLTKENIRKKNEIKGYLDYAVNNALNAIRYERLNPEGPYYEKRVTPECPLVAPYFNHSPYDQFTVAKEEALMYKSGQLFMAHNGWVMGATTDCQSEDFGSPNSHIYLKRELIAWGDCIKLRYGADAKEVPFLWDYIKKYVKAQAKVFHGFRIDNCHSTPLHVAEFVVDVARSVRPDIYIMAELFTSSELADNIFVNRLGITSLIRESMSAHDARELGRLMHRFGGTPVGAFYPQGAEPLKPGVAHAIFYDQTHDNESPVVRRSAHDVGPTAAIINMANCASGSNRGYDELVPHHINVVTESRLYSDSIADETLGILLLRKMINGPLQRELSQGFSEIFVDQVNDDVIAITRHNPVDGRSIVLVARTAFFKEHGSCYIKPITIEGQVSKIIFEAQSFGDPQKYERNDKYINGLTHFKTKIFNANSQVSEAKLAKISHIDGDKTEVELNEFVFLPSSVLAFEVSLSQKQTESLKQINQWQVNLEKFNLTLDDANYILFRVAEEDGYHPYALPNFCSFTYSGLYGLMYHLEKVRENQDQAHPLAMNLRAGYWLSEYIVNRLNRRPSTQPLAAHLESVLRAIDTLPRGMVPKYFDLIIGNLYNSVVEMVYSRMSAFVSKGPKLVKLLALSSVALVSECESAPLPPVDTKLTYLPSIAAGLPHFASGYMRNWGRDTFISLRGLLLMTGRFSEAKCIILAYARTLRHGLIPNLLDGGTRSRYNCRDAVWWWLYSIREYTRLAPNGNEILRHKVRRIHKPEAPANGLPQRKRSTAQVNGTSGVGLTSTDPSVQQLCDVIQEALECHFKGVTFVEENAGKQLDEHMKEEGFTVSYGVSNETGFVFGGNEWNCGTWMDKMGSSEKAGTKGKPSSPRDGSAVEIVGLCKAVVTWLDEAHRNGRAYPYDGVEFLYDNTITLKWTWKKWASLIQANFEKYFYIPLENEKPMVDDPNANLINRRGIYKDTLGATHSWQDYQFRPNFLVAMVVAPELFDPAHARHALALTKRCLCGPLGMKTLDPTDWNYRGDYDNGNDSTDPKVAHGFNYHQGPEWLWPTGYYIRASSRFCGASERPHHLQLLSSFYATLVENPWLGLPELNNENGKPCPGSCHIQAWSLGTALEALHESARNS